MICAKWRGRGARLGRNEFRPYHREERGWRAPVKRGPIFRNAVDRFHPLELHGQLTERFGPRSMPR
ncbi:hypothetical protein SBV1_800004 [Verrucomicrobia bacterium]|nr:hypothetical protein SBV1_800004 [Verrucomicrobiota bacterium]